MNALTIRLPASLHQNIKELAKREGMSVNQFIASATAEKMASVLTVEFPRREAAAGRRSLSRSGTGCGTAGWGRAAVSRPAPDRH